MRRHVTIALCAGLLLTACSDAADDPGIEDGAAEAVGDDSAAGFELDEASADVPIQETVVDTADALSEVDVPGGGRLVATLQCGDDAQVLTLAGANMTAGVYAASLEPAAGGDVTIQINEDGVGVGARQGTYDAAEYTLTLADLDGLSFVLDGCG